MITTVLAVSVLAVWVLGIVLFALVTPRQIQDEPMMRLVFDTAPAAAALFAALLIVFWPAAVGARILARHSQRNR
ncbi:hypothetical protein [Streptomyces synnematoformans]|uniref:Uncharacterized protein n=1 Tax=Streptomyces synnematoformans TaxID=415721 RepID=A0ABN2XCB0_9ACTN